MCTLSQLQRCGGLLGSRKRKHKIPTPLCSLLEEGWDDEVADFLGCPNIGSGGGSRAGPGTDLLRAIQRKKSVLQNTWLGGSLRVERYPSADKFQSWGKEKPGKLQPVPSQDISLAQASQRILTN